MQAGAAGKECWCDSEMNTAGPPANPKGEAKACNNPCAGDPAEMCGGHFMASVVEVPQADLAAWLFIALALLGGAVYVGGGVISGGRRGGGRGLRAHAHYSRWVEVGGLVMDGVAFAR